MSSSCFRPALFNASSPAFSTTAAAASTTGATVARTTGGAVARTTGGAVARTTGGAVARTTGATVASGGTGEPWRRWDVMIFGGFDAPGKHRNSYHGFLRQLWLVLGVKLMEINSNDCFPVK